MKVLFVLTSHDKLGDTEHKTGFWLEEFAAPYYFLKDAKVDITLASPKGGQPPLDPNSDSEDAQTDATRRFKDDPEAQQHFAKTLKLSDVSADDYNAVFYPGGHGPLWDLANDQDSIALIKSFIKQDKIVSAVCHAPAALVNVNLDNNDPLVKGKKVTGFTNSEEAAVELTEVVPFLLEDKLSELGANYTKGDDWSDYVVEDGLLITGQNPASSEGVAKRLLERLK